MPGRFHIGGLEELCCALGVGFDQRLTNAPGLPTRGKLLASAAVRKREPSRSACHPIPDGSSEYRLARARVVDLRAPGHALLFLHHPRRDILVFLNWRLRELVDLDYPDARCMRVVQDRRQDASPLSAK